MWADARLDNIRARLNKLPLNSLLQVCAVLCCLYDEGQVYRAEASRNDDITVDDVTRLVSQVCPLPVDV